MCSPCAPLCTGSCHQVRRADGWGLRDDGSAAEPAGCRLGRSRVQRSVSRSHRRKQTGRGWSQNRRWCHFGPVSSLQSRHKSEWERFNSPGFSLKDVDDTQPTITCNPNLTLRHHLLPKKNNLWADDSSDVRSLPFGSSVSFYGSFFSKSSSF